MRHESLEALLLERLRHRVGQGVGSRAVHRRIGEGADAIELRGGQEIEQHLEIRVGFARKADDEGAAQGQLGADATPRLQAFKGILGGGRAFHALQDTRAAVLQRHVEIGQDRPLSHERDQLIDVRIGIDVVQAHPGAQAAQGAGQLGQAGAYGLAVPEIGTVPEIHAIGAGVL